MFFDVKAPATKRGQLGAELVCSPTVTARLLDPETQLSLEQVAEQQLLDAGARFKAQQLHEAGARIRAQQSHAVRRGVGATRRANPSSRSRASPPRSSQSEPPRHGREGALSPSAVVSVKDDSRGNAVDLYQQSTKALLSTKPSPVLQGNYHQPVSTPAASSSSGTQQRSSRPGSSSQVLEGQLTGWPASNDVAPPLMDPADWVAKQRQEVNEIRHTHMSELEKHQRQIGELRQCQVSDQIMITQLEAEVQQLQNCQFNDRMMISQYEEDLDSLRAERLPLHHLVASLHSQLALQHETSELKPVGVKSGQISEPVATQVGSPCDNCERLELQKELLLEELVDLKTELAAEKTETIRLSEDEDLPGNKQLSGADVDSQLAELERQCAQQQRQLGKLQPHNEQLRQELDTMRAQVVDLEQQLAVLRRKERQAAVNAPQKEQMEETMMDLQLQCEDQDQELRHLRPKVGEMRQQLATLQQERDREHDNAVSEMEARLAQLEELRAQNLWKSSNESTECERCAKMAEQLHASEERALVLEEKTRKQATALDTSQACIELQIQRISELEDVKASDLSDQKEMIQSGLWKQPIQVHDATMHVFMYACIGHQSDSVQQLLMNSVCFRTKHSVS